MRKGNSNTIKFASVVHVLPGSRDLDGDKTDNNSIIEYVKLLMSVGLVLLSVSAVGLNIWSGLQPKSTQSIAKQSSGQVSKTLQQGPIYQLSRQERKYNSHVNNNLNRNENVYKHNANQSINVNERFPSNLQAQEYVKKHANDIKKAGYTRVQVEEYSDHTFKVDYLK